MFRQQKDLHMSKAIVFPGQGSQTVGMGRDLAEAFQEAKDVFAEVDDALNQKLSTIMFTGPEEDLRLTANAQPAIMAASIAVLRVLEKQIGFSVKDAAFVAGHSLGEYTALCAAGAISLSETARLLRTRGDAMQAAVPVGVGAMAALIGADFEQAKKIAAEAAQGEVCTAANDNAPGQVVISGHASAIDRAIKIAAEQGLKRAVILPVSAPFHCPLMKPAADVMLNALALAKVQAPMVPLIANVTAEAVTDPMLIRALLVQQVTGTVRWRESMLWAETQGVDGLTELGGSVLAGMAKRISPNLPCQSVVKAEDIEKFYEASRNRAAAR